MRSINRIVTGIKSGYSAGISRIKEFVYRLKTLFVNTFTSIDRKYFQMGIAFLLVLTIPILVRVVVLSTTSFRNNGPEMSEEELSLISDKIDADTKKMERKLAAKTPSSYYLVINSAANEFSLYKGGKLIRKDKCSTGSYILLKAGDEQEWMFKTPKGEFRIQGKTTAPVWRKPDWAFIEEGLPVPAANHHTRFEAGVLGDYALSLGQGYLIHGTLYQRFLGLPVTHGCIRLNDENLELVYRSLQVGSKVYIY